MLAVTIALDDLFGPFPFWPDHTSQQVWGSVSFVPVCSRRTASLRRGVISVAAAHTSSRVTMLVADHQVD
eukprot:443381-Amphidinium_carterae.1